jgi:pyridoxamine 5'-phosphate oxidase
VTPSTFPPGVPDPAAMRRDYGRIVGAQSDQVTGEAAGDLLGAPVQGPAGVDLGLGEELLEPRWTSQFARWLTDAVAAGLPEPNAMVLATADSQGRPSARTVLLKGYDERGFTFYTNYGSRKGTEALANPYASLVFPWHPLHRQVVVCGAIRPVTRAETEAYFARRPRAAQLGAWASPQSTVIDNRSRLEAAVRELEQRWPDGEPIPAPPHWGGLRVVPDTVEFWHGRSGRLHDRLRFRRADDGWVVERLAP